MAIDRIFALFSPKDRKFFPLFEKATQNLLVASGVLVEALQTSSPDRRRELLKEIERLEHQGDNFTHLILHELSSNFITPFDREDIHALATVLDDVLDYIHGSAKRIELYKVEVISPAMVKLAELIQKSAQELNVAVHELKNMKNISNIKEACVRINSIENHADDVFNTAIGRLFEEEKDAVKLIKYKEILSALETATDKCEDAANVMESIIVKNA
jgi:predicted phosphate transport protein (TIGR00153 family)